MYAVLHIVKDSDCSRVWAMRPRGFFFKFFGLPNVKISLPLCKLCKK